MSNIEIPLPWAHNDLNDNSGRVRCRELLTKNLRNFGRTQHYTEEEADAKILRHSCRSSHAAGDGRAVCLRVLRLAVLRRPNPTSPTTRSMTTGSARPRASFTVPTKSKTRHWSGAPPAHVTCDRPASSRSESLSTAWRRGRGPLRSNGRMRWRLHSQDARFSMGRRPISPPPR